ncbi:MAG TPA: hypothetical protein VM008_10445 [Phycisphaerae bacterium]|nr:hypothetical protein [Phycisphaerae bacterium]
MSFVILSTLLTACHSHSTPQEPTITRTGIKPPSISIDADTGWAAAPIAHGTPLFTDDYYSVQFYPPALQGAILIQRPESVAVNAGYLDGKVSVPAPATLYVAILYQVNNDRLIPDATLHALTSDGWTKTPGIFSTSSPDNLNWYWTIYSHPIPPGPVTLSSKDLLHPGVLIIGKQHENAPQARPH